MDYRQTQYPKKLKALKKSLGVIKHECIAINVNGRNEINDVRLKPGNLIQFIPKYHKGGRQFKIWNFKDHNSKKSAIYKCTKNDYLVIAMKLWPYIFALENNSDRIQFVQSVYNRKFDMKLLKLGSEIRIKRQVDADIKNYKFVVTHNGIVHQVGTGYYIGLQLKNTHLSLTEDLKDLSKYYKFGGTGIVVSAYWLMLNLFDRFKLNNQPFQCFPCDKNISINQGVIFWGCQHSICLACCEEYIGMYISMSQNPKCPLCQKSLEQFEVNYILTIKPNLLNGNQNQNKKVVESLNLLRISNISDTILTIPEVLDSSYNRTDSNHNLDNCFECFVCVQSVNCVSQIVLSKCKHEICKDCLCKTILYRKSLSKSLICPICNKVIDHIQLEALGLSNTALENEIQNSELNIIEVDNDSDQIQDNLVDICRTCQKQADMNLALCQHPFCHRCIQDWIRNQVLDPKKINITCTACNTLVTDSDISQYVKEEMLVLYKRKIESNITSSITLTGNEMWHQQKDVIVESITNVSNDSKHLFEYFGEPNIILQQENDKFECTMCEKLLNTKCRIILAKCGDAYCRNCVSDIILKQWKFLLVPKCPVCQTPLAEENLLIFKPTYDSNAERQEVLLNNNSNSGDDEMFFCGICEHQFEMKATKVLSVCQDRFCRTCITKAINKQTLFNIPHSCPLCAKYMCPEDINDLCSSTC